jgi:hypothetical protein
MREWIAGRLTQQARATRYDRLSPTFATKSAQSGHPDLLNQCPLLGVKRTSRFDRVMSASDPKRTYAA